MNGIASRAFRMVGQPLAGYMRLLSVVITLLVLLLPPAALAGNGNGNNNGNANGYNNGNAYGHDKGDGSGSSSESSGDSSGSQQGSSPAGSVLSPQGALDAADQNLALDAVEAGKALPLNEIARRVRARFRARIIDAHLVTRGNTLVYQLTIVTPQGVSKKLDVDAEAGDPVGNN